MHPRIHFHADGSYQHQIKQWQALFFYPDNWLLYAKNQWTMISVNELLARPTLARPFWPIKLQALDLNRFTYWVNPPYYVKLFISQRLHIWRYVNGIASCSNHSVEIINHRYSISNISHWASKPRSTIKCNLFSSSFTFKWSSRGQMYRGKQIAWLTSFRQPSVASLW